MTDPIETEIPYHLQQAIEGGSGLGSLEVHLGWVENDEFETPSVSILKGALSRRPDRMIEDVTSVDASTVEVTFRDAFVELPITLELYTETKTQRLQFLEPLRRLFHPEPPDNLSGQPPEGLDLTLDNHHDAPARVFLRDSQAQDGEAVNEGLYRQTIELTAESEERTRREYPKHEFRDTQEIV